MLLFPCKNFLHYWDRFQGKIGVPDREKNLWERGQEPATNLTYLLCSGGQMFSPLRFSCSILALRSCSTVAPPLLHTRSTHALFLPQPSATLAPSLLQPCSAHVTPLLRPGVVREIEAWWWWASVRRYANYLLSPMEPLHLVVAVCFKWLTLCESKNLSQHTQTEVSGSIQ